ncbi:MAG: acylphosphatase [Planctomycetaceae bacterium]|nr:acylphosphatase [Planctomycetaceae bacterium]
MAMEQAARHIIWRGRVQGVGFRFTVRQIAAQYDVAGTVKNLCDGSVEAVLQGPADRVQGCIEDIAAEFRGYIREVKSENLPVNPHLTDFRILH